MNKLEKIGGLLLKLDNGIYFTEDGIPYKKLTNDEYDILNNMFGSICECYGFYQDILGFCTYFKLDGFEESCDNVFNRIKNTKEFNDKILRIEKIYFTTVESYEIT